MPIRVKPYLPLQNAPSKTDLNGIAEPQVAAYNNQSAKTRTSPRSSCTTKTPLKINCFFAPILMFIEVLYFELAREIVVNVWLLISDEVSVLKTESFSAIGGTSNALRFSSVSAGAGRKEFYRKKQHVRGGCITQAESFLLCSVIQLVLLLLAKWF